MVLLIIACASGHVDSASNCDNAQFVEWNYWASGFFTTYCNGCHSVESSNRYGAPDGINFDSEADVQSRSHEIYKSVLINETMPKGGGVEQSELDNLQVYLHCWTEG